MRAYQLFVGNGSFSHENFSISWYDGACACFPSLYWDVSVTYHHQLGGEGLQQGVGVIFHNLSPVHFMNTMLYFLPVNSFTEEVVFSKGRVSWYAVIWPLHPVFHVGCVYDD